MSLKRQKDKCVDIYGCPELDLDLWVKQQPYQLPRTEMTLGDLHGNAIKLLYSLTRHGVITNMTPIHYASLVRIYRLSADQLTRRDIACFNEIIRGLKFNKSCLIRLLGDDLADRGSNDYFTLRIIEKLIDEKVPIEILLSNHSIDFIYAYENVKKVEERHTWFEWPSLSGFSRLLSSAMPSGHTRQLVDLNSKFILPEPDDLPQNNIQQRQIKFLPKVLEKKLHHADSLVSLNHLIRKKIVSKSEIETIYKKYQRVLKAISYNINKDRKGIVIFSHAPIDLKQIERICLQLNVTYQDSTIEHLAKTIDRINEKIAMYGKIDQLSVVFPREEARTAYEEDCLFLSPLTKLLWNRATDELSTAPRESRCRSYDVKFAHGHAIEIGSSSHRINMDNTLGKRYIDVRPYQVEENNVGEYSVLYGDHFNKKKLSNRRVARSQFFDHENSNGHYRKKNHLSCRAESASHRESIRYR
jgi:hypothetical protein